MVGPISFTSMGGVLVAVIYAAATANIVEGDVESEDPFGHLNYFFVDANVIVVDIVHSLFPLVELQELETAALVDEEIIVSGLFHDGAVVALVHLHEMVQASSAPVPVLSSYWMQLDYLSQNLHTFCRLTLHVSQMCKICTM